MQVAKTGAKKLKSNAKLLTHGARKLKSNAKLLIVVARKRGYGNWPPNQQRIYSNRVHLSSACY